MPLLALTGAPPSLLARLAALESPITTGELCRARAVRRSLVLTHPVRCTCQWRHFASRTCRQSLPSVEWASRYVVVLAQGSADARLAGSRAPRVCAPRACVPRGWDSQDLRELQYLAASQHAAPPVSAATLLDTALANRLTISTGCRTIDDMLGGGLRTGEVVEIAGPPGSGKTQVRQHANRSVPLVAAGAEEAVCAARLTSRLSSVQMVLSSCVNAVVATDATALFIDTHNAFNPSRVQAIFRNRSAGWRSDDVRRDARQRSWACTGACARGAA